MTKHKNSSQRTPQTDKSRGDFSKKTYSDLTLRPTTGTTSAPSQKELEPATILQAAELPTTITQTTTVAPVGGELQRILFTTPHQAAAIVNNTTPPGAPDKQKDVN